uniref:SFRICE_005292 n=1 Tax=Spodoptera frugiperda TaxID=7108 RepID=A0A2H1WJA1_SPOFR
MRSKKYQTDFTKDHNAICTQHRCLKYVVRHTNIECPFLFEARDIGPLYRQHPPPGISDVVLAEVQREQATQARDWIRIIPYGEDILTAVWIKIAYKWPLLTKASSHTEKMEPHVVNKKAREFIADNEKKSILKGHESVAPNRKPSVTRCKVRRNAVDLKTESYGQ